MKDRVGWFFVGLCAGVLFSVLGADSLDREAWMQAIGAGVVLGVLSGWLVPRVMTLHPEHRHGARKRVG